MSPSAMLCVVSTRRLRRIIRDRVCGRKYKAKLTELWNFAKKIPGIGSLLELPGGSNQLRHMKMPLVQALWMEKHPVDFFLFSLLPCFSTFFAQLTTILPSECRGP